MNENTKFFEKTEVSRDGTQDVIPASHYGSIQNNTSHNGSGDSPTESLIDANFDNDLRSDIDVAIIHPETKKQSSIITIFSIWNTMVGTSMLCIPWAINRSGFGCGVVVLVLMALITLYTAYLIVKSHQNLGLPLGADFTDVCKHHFGRLGAFASLFLSLLSLASAVIVYWILMSNFLFYTVDFVYEMANHEFKNASNSSFNDVICYPPSEPPPSAVHPFSSLLQSFYDEKASKSYLDTLPAIQASSDATYHAIWNLHTTAPLFLIIILFPLISLKSPTFFTKFTAFGTISIVFLLFFVTLKASRWGIHLTFTDSSVPSFSGNFHWTFPTMTGMLSLAYFIHNAILALLSHQRKPSNNCRDLSIAYMLVMCTFCYIGILFYASFPLPKHCIADNLLNNFVNSDTWAFMARVFLLIQMTTTLPLLLFILKGQVLKCLFNTISPGTLQLFISNVIMVTCCVLFAIFYPQVGNVIRYFGSICGFGYIFTLPPLVRMIQLKRCNKLSTHTLFFHSFLIVVGAANFLVQFFI